MQAVVKFLFTAFTVISVFFTNLFSPAVIVPESENFDFSCLTYPEEAIITLEEAGLTEQELVGRASAELPEYVQPVDFVFIDKMPLTPIGKVDYRALEKETEKL